MKAAVLYGPHTPFVVEDLALMAPRAGEIVVRIGACGVCRSDHHILDGSLPARFPLVLGHEAAGTVEAVGPGVASPRPGQRVVSELRRHCGVCHHCRTGRIALCTSLSGMTQNALPDGVTPFSKGGQPVYQFNGIGGFSERIVIPAVAAVPLADEMPLASAALIGCGVITGLGAALRTARVQPGASVAVIGTGGVGISVIQGARIAGAGRIIGVDLLPGRLEMAMRFGATHAVNASEGDPVEAVRRLTGGYGADYTFDAIGGARTMLQAFNMARTGGTVTFVGVPPITDQVTFPAMALFGNQKTLHGCVMGGDSGARLAALATDLYRSGQLKLDEMVSKTYTLDEVNEAFAALERGENVRGVVRID